MGDEMTQTEQQKELNRRKKYSNEYRFELLEKDSMYCSKLLGEVIDLLKGIREIIK